MRGARAAGEEERYPAASPAARPSNERNTCSPEKAAHLKQILCSALLAASLTPRGLEAAAPASAEAWKQAAENGVRSEEVFRRTHHMLTAWLAYADERTLLLPDYLPGYTRGQREQGVYTPHNSGADNYPYLLATAFFTDRALYDDDRRSAQRFAHDDEHDEVLPRRVRRRTAWRRSRS